MKLGHHSLSESSVEVVVHLHQPRMMELQEWVVTVLLIGRTIRVESIVL